jgi:Histidine kinase-, DNA gyrase B-, and HSP90-like ATPase
MATQTKLRSFSGSTNITNASIKKHFKRYEPWQSIAELIWNGLDARATRIDIEIQKNELYGFDVISILDNGDGIDFENLEDNFERFDDTIKNDVGQHGSNGRGRLSFYKISNEAVWFTKFKNKSASIYINSSTLKDFRGDYLDKAEQHSRLASLNSGTYVKLTGFAKRKHSLNVDNLPDRLAAEFGWFLALQKDRQIFVNGKKINIPGHEIQDFSVSILNKNFQISIIRWEEKPRSEKSYNYLLNSQNRIVYKKLSTFNNKTKFHISAYASSSWADNFDPGDPNLFTSVDDTSQSKIWKQLLETLCEKTRIIYEDFLRKFAEEQIIKLESDGVFPSYDGEDEETAHWRVNNIKELIRNIYIADPTILNSLKLKQQKIIVRLLDKLLVSNENDALLEILESVIDLEDHHVRSLAEQLKKTKLEHIVSTIEVLQKREIVVQKLREVMKHHYKNVLETPDLQKVIEANTWLFGSQYSILGAEEDDFVAIAKKFRDQIPDISSISEDDLEDPKESSKEIDGVRKQVDLFLARKVPQYDAMGNQYYKCIIIEIKRPGISLNDKHLRQIDEYAKILDRQPEYRSELIKFEIILVGRAISQGTFDIKNRLKDNEEKGENGLVSTGKFKRYIKSWYTIFDQFELTNQYLLKHLKTKREDLSKSTSDQLISELQKSSQ